MAVNELKREFRGKYPNNAIASYDYLDLINGLGINVFYLCTSYDLAGGTTYNITDRVSRSANNAVQFGAGAEVNFNSIPFNTPRVVKGSISLIVGQCHAVSAGSAFKFQVMKVSGGVETAITAELTAAVMSAATGSYTRIDLPLTATEVLFKVGDYLRLEVITTSGGGNVYLGTSPTEEAFGGTLITTKTEMLVPFKILE